jgi:hypothetical protein
MILPYCEEICFSQRFGKWIDSAWSGTIDLRSVWLSTMLGWTSIFICCKDLVSSNFKWLWFALNLQPQVFISPLFLWLSPPFEKNSALFWNFNFKNNPSWFIMQNSATGFLKIPVHNAIAVLFIYLWPTRCFVLYSATHIFTAQLVETFYLWQCWFQTI